VKNIHNSLMNLSFYLCFVKSV